MAAIEETMGTLGQQLYQEVIGNINGGILHSQTGALASAVELSAVETTGATSSVWVEIPNDGSKEFIYGMALEWGGLGYYDIMPLEQFFEIAGLGGAGRLSPFSHDKSVAVAEGRLPHSLMWVQDGAAHFAKIVHHPPSKEFAYMRTSLDEIEDTAMTWLGKTLDYVLGASA
jgi:hypothetical protein